MGVSQPGEDGCDGVSISNGRCAVRLKRAEPPGLGYPTLIEVKAAPFTGTVKDDTVCDYGTFQTQLIELHRSLSGEAKLGSYEGFSLVLSGNGRGAINVAVIVIGEHVPPIRLDLKFTIDQTYLPRIIRQIDEEFPPPYRDASR
jgi:hypothetical protein